MNKNANYQSPTTVRTAIEAQTLLIGGSPAANIEGSGGTAGGNTGGGKW